MKHPHIYLSRPLGTFVMLMKGRIEFHGVSPIELKAWDTAWKEKSRWYRTRIHSATPTIVGPVGEVYQTWITLGDQAFT